MQSENQYYEAHSDVNFREGPSTNYEVLDVIHKGDTVKLIEDTNSSWAKLNFQGQEGYSSLRFFIKISVPENPSDNVSQANMVDDEEKNPLLQFWIMWLVLGGLLSILVYYLGRTTNRNRTLAVLLSLFTGFMGLQKFYLGKFQQGLLCLIFFWTFIPILFGLWDMVKLSIMSEEKFQFKFNGIILSKAKRVKVEITKNKIEDNRNYSVLNHSNNGVRYSSRLRENVESSTWEPEKNIESSEPNSFSTRSSNYSENQLKSSSRYNSNDIKSGVDSSIIDIEDEDLEIAIPKEFTDEPPINQSQYDPSRSSKVPFWHKFYVYSYNDLNSANQAQKKFYKYFRNRLLNNQWTDIDGNTNYAFVLYFDLLDRYNEHQDIDLLENQLKLLGDCCSETRNYSYSALIHLLSRRNDQKSIEKLEQLRDPSIRYELGFADYDPYAYRLGRLYKEKLNLSDKQEDWLNKFYNPSNVFNSIEGCCVAIMQLYLKVLETLDENLQSEKSSLEEEIKKLQDRVSTRSSSDYDRYNYDYMAEQVEQEVFLILFKTTENSVREEYSHKRKLSTEFSYNIKKIDVEFEEKIRSRFINILEKNTDSISEPDLDTQIALNAQNVNRWKEEFNKAKSHLKTKDITAFINNVKQLEVANQKNPNIENIFFEASKAIAKYNKPQALIYYAKYIDYDLNSDKIHNKKLTKTVQKSLFKTNEQLKKFEEIIQDLINNQNLNDALIQFKEFYKPSRKKIVLNKKDINDAREKHKNTVNILSDYLEDEENKTVEIDDSDDEIEMSITAKKDSELSIFLNDLGLNSLQQKILKKIAEKNFTIQQDVIEAVALENGQMKNQLIDSINEICSDILDGEFIIEEDEDNYIVEESFYTELLKK